MYMPGSQRGRVGDARVHHEVTVATLLARSKMTDWRGDLRQGFSHDDEEQSGDFSGRVHLFQVGGTEDHSDPAPPAGVSTDQAHGSGSTSGGRAAAASGEDGLSAIYPS